MEDLEDLIERKMHDLLEEARDEANRYWEFRHEENGKRPAEERTALGVRANIKGGAAASNGSATRAKAG